MESCPYPEFLHVRKGDYIVIQGELSRSEGEGTEYWIAPVIHVVGGSRNSSVNTIFQVANIDTGQIAYINADLAMKILRKP